MRSLYVPDPLGSTVALLDNTQTKTDTWVYWPYGEVKTRTGTNATAFQFVGTLGYYQDSATRAYVRARYLDTQKGRWLTEECDTRSHVQLSWPAWMRAHDRVSHHAYPTSYCGEATSRGKRSDNVSIPRGEPGNREGTGSCQRQGGEEQG